MSKELKSYIVSVPARCIKTILIKAASAKEAKYKYDNMIDLHDQEAVDVQVYWSGKAKNVVLDR